MQVTLKRHLVVGEVTEGQLSVEGCTFCQTLENTHSCLPAGRYPLTLVKCTQYARKMITVVTDYTPTSPSQASTPPSQAAAPQPRRKACSRKKPPRRCRRCPRKEQMSLNTCLPRYCPMLKPGNGIHGRKDGSILLGTRTALGLLVHPRASFDRLYDRLRKNQERGHEAQLLITE